jgi:hypothetical protein
MRKRFGDCAPYLCLSESEQRAPKRSLSICRRL